MKTDNPAHKALFTIPEATHSTVVATTKPLPPQQVITGHKQTDAYLWVLEVIQTNEPAHLPAAEEALSKLKITPKDAGAIQSVPAQKWCCAVPDCLWHHVYG